MLAASSTTTPATTLAHQELARKIWKECWDEFHQWKEAYSQHELTRLTQSTRTGPAVIKMEEDLEDSMNTDASESYASQFPEAPTIEEVQEEDEDELVDDNELDVQTMTVWKFPSASPSGTTINPTIVAFPTYPGHDTFQPVPPYESCTPLAQSISMTNMPTAADLEELKFLPFGDEPDFYVKNDEFLVAADEDTGQMKQMFTHLWELTDERNPDVDLVVCEAARRLHYDHGLTIEQIDLTDVLPRTLILENGSMWNPHTTRTLLPWPQTALFETKPTFKDLIPPIKPPTTAERVARLSKLMCMSLSCVQPACPVHGLGPQPVPHRTRPKLTDMVAACDPESCGLDCFQIRDHNPETLRWKEEEVLELSDIWDMWDTEADLDVCSLAVMVFKPCWEVFAQLRQLAAAGPFDLSPSLSPTSPKLGKNGKPKKKKKKPVFDVLDYKSYEFARPCEHAGPCDQKSRCVCYISSRRCKRNCQCGPSCERRHQGCKCSAKEGVCGTGWCTCHRYLLECDPELCGKCGAKSGTPCTNVSLLHGRRKATKVVMKEYSWGRGWGLEIAEPAGVADLIDEYVGELVTTTEYEFRRVMAEYVGRNYLFSLDKDRTIDSARAANETRFINHEKGSKANCMAEIRFVDGEPRIGIYAKRKIRAGEELFFDYGEEFFQHADPPSPAGTQESVEV